MGDFRAVDRIALVVDVDCPVRAVITASALSAYECSHQTHHERLEYESIFAASMLRLSAVSIGAPEPSLPRSLRQIEVGAPC